MRQVMQYAVIAGCYVGLLTNGYHLFAFRFEVVMDHVPVCYNPATLVLHLTTVLVHERVRPMNLRAKNQSQACCL